MSQKTKNTWQIFLRWLKEEGLYWQYRNNYLSSKPQLRMSAFCGSLSDFTKYQEKRQKYVTSNMAEIILYSFVWSKTQESPLLWSAANEKWQHYYYNLH